MDKPKLRDYQRATVNQVYKAITSRRTRIAVSLPTSAGKSLILSQIATDCSSKGKNTLILVHRKALVAQLKSTLEAFGNEVDVIAAGYPKPKSQKQITIAMVQTLDRRDLPESIDLIMLDEAHLTAYFEVFERCLDKYLGNIWALSKKPVIGFSATFWRTNKKEGYCRWFNHKIQGVSSRSLINQGYLTKPSVFTYETSLDLSDVKLDSSGEFNLAAIRKVCNYEYLQDVTCKWSENYKALKTIFFVSGVDKAKELKDLIKAQSVSAEILDGKTPNAKRTKILADFKSGKITALVNVGVLTEGFDEPSIECVVLARPSKSIALIVQMIGRGLRLFEGKIKAVILDLSESIYTLLDNNQAGDEAFDKEDIF